MLKSVWSSDSIVLHRNAVLFFLVCCGLLVLSESSNQIRREYGYIPVQTSSDPIWNVSLQEGFNGATFHIALHVVHPFVFFDSNKTGNERFEGVTIEMIEKLSEVLDFNYVMELGSEDAPQSSIAAMDAVGIGKPVGSEHWADFAAGAIHITSERSLFAHFSLPYLETGYSLVVQRPKESHPFWAFLGPFDLSLWMTVLIEMVVVAICFFLFESPIFSVEDETDVADGWWLGLWDSIYWSASALTQTLDKAPMTWGGKVIMLAHGWFMLIIIASYTANLAAALTASSLAPSINSWSDLISSANGRGYKLSLPRGLSHEEFIAFESSHYGYEFDIEWTNSWEEALDAVVNGTDDVQVAFHDLPMVQYFLWHDMQLEEDEEDRCAIMRVGTTFAQVRCPAPPFGAAVQAGIKALRPRQIGYGLAFGSDDPRFLAFSQVCACECPACPSFTSGLLRRDLAQSSETHALNPKARIRTLDPGPCSKAPQRCASGGGLRR